MKKMTGALAAVALLALPAAAQAATPGWDGQGAFHPTSGQVAKGSMKVKQSAGVFTIRATFTHLAPGSHHAVDVHSGDCGAPGASVLTLPDIVANGSGVATLRTSATAPTGVDLVENDYYVDVHAGTGATAGDAITCANVYEYHNNAVAPVVQTGTSGVSGTVRFWQRGNVLKGIITLHGLVPGSTHAMHIHTGSCAVQGGIVQPLPDQTANSAGVVRAEVKLTTFEDAVGSGFNFNLHQSASPTFGGGIACGDLQPATSIFAKPKPVKAKPATNPVHVTKVIVVKKNGKKIVVVKVVKKGKQHASTNA